MMRLTALGQLDAAVRKPPRPKDPGDKVIWKVGPQICERHQAWPAPRMRRQVMRRRWCVARMRRTDYWGVQFLRPLRVCQRPARSGGVETRSKKLSLGEPTEPRKAPLQGSLPSLRVPQAPQDWLRRTQQEPNSRVRALRFSDRPSRQKTSGSTLVPDICALLPP
jgi:hypothetical protein